MTSEQQFSEELADVITTAMAVKGISIKDLSNLVDVTYEHARRITKGFPPSKPVLRVLCAALDLDYDQLSEVVVRASIRRRFGDVAAAQESSNPELAPIERAWKHLSAEQKQDAISMIQAMAKRSKQQLVKA